MKTITFQSPLEIRAKEGGEVIEKIESCTVRALKTGDLLSALDAAGEDKMGSLLAHLASRATRLTVKQIQSLSLEDGVEVIQTVESFLPASLRTGRLASPSSQGLSDTPPTFGDGDQES
ncbi:MAG: phage tail assembly protein [Rhodospirillaceae bacterium]|nr:MAG: phage tail assembly protein [Rhodospirillaceae bacterium]